MLENCIFKTFLGILQAPGTTYKDHLTPESGSKPKITINFPSLFKFFWKLDSWNKLSPLCMSQRARAPVTVASHMTWCCSEQAKGVLCFVICSNLKALENERRCPIVKFFFATCFLILFVSQTLSAMMIVLITIRRVWLSFSVGKSIFGWTIFLADFATRCWDFSLNTQSLYFSSL